MNMEPFNGKFCFINQDTSTGLTKAKRSQVHRHIHSVYRHSRLKPRPYRSWHHQHRRPSPGIILASTTEPTAAIQSSAEDGTKEAASDEHAIVSSQEPSIITRSNPEHKEQSQLIPRARTVLQKGNSDPFHCMPFKVNANMTMMLRAYHVFFLPFGLAPETRAVEPMTGKKQHIQAFTNALQDRLQGQALVTILMIVLARESNNDRLRTQALYHKGRVLQDFHIRLAKLYSTASSSAAIQMMTMLMFAMEAEARENMAANVHANALSSFLSGIGGLESIDPGYLERTLSLDEGYCTLHPQRSYLSFPNWKLAPLVDLLSPYIGHRPELGILNFPWDLFDQQCDIHRTWQDLKEIIVLDCYLYSLRERLEFQAFRLLHNQRFICQSRMLNHFYDLQDSLCNAHRGESEVMLIFQAAVAMAALYYSRFLYRDNSYLRNKNFPLDSLVECTCSKPVL